MEPEVVNRLFKVEYFQVSPGRQGPFSMSAVNPWRIREQRSELKIRATDLAEAWHLAKRICGRMNRVTSIREVFGGQ